MLPHSDTLSWLRANQYLLFLLNAACLAEKQQIPIVVFGFTWLRLELSIYHIRGGHASHYNTDVVQNKKFEDNGQPSHGGDRKNFEVMTST